MSDDRLHFFVTEREYDYAKRGENYGGMIQENNECYIPMSVSIDRASVHRGKVSVRGTDMNSYR